MDQRDNQEYWNKRAKEIDDEDLVTHRDLFQKKLELELIVPHLKSGMHVLEVGCGNGFVTEFLAQRVGRVDAFDISEEMIKRAEKKLASKKNCRLFVKGLPAPSAEGLALQYDVIVSVRVLINLPNREVQSEAIDWIASRLKQGGKLLLLEGSRDGLEAINALRATAGLSTIKEAAFNLNMRKEWLENVAGRHFDISSKSSIGVYDFLTRFFYPLLVGEDKVEYNTSFHEAAFKASRITPDDSSMPWFSRLHVYVLTKR